MTIKITKAARAEMAVLVAKEKQYMDHIRSYVDGLETPEQAFDAEQIKRAFRSELVSSAVRLSRLLQGKPANE